ncbi:MAG: 7-cyano-7-deazaguanine synthase QueC [Micavibrio sp.]|nr:7-cyano-7-deazaguanine synthase QueC [Micavibrio sp.]|tara:strand:- start:327 stop:1013 length:687 start_codon:yes stop_codon:yes gene_type:complete
MKTLLICSGGLDSITLAYKISKERTLAGLLSFDYGQRHKKELGYAAQAADDLDVPHYISDISGIGKMLSGSALTDDLDVPDGHYAEETMKITVVPNRNAIMLSIAYGIASAKQLGAVAAAFHGGDHFIYPDCRPEFVESFAAMQNLALDGYADIELFTPFVTWSKADIVREGDGIAVPFEKSWSCYKGGDIHCGRCGTCVERIEAFELAGVKDPTGYEDREFWKEKVG